MKCQDCDSEMVRILGEDYCPSCAGIHFKLKKHIRIPKDYSQSIRAILWGTATALVLVVFFVFLRPYILPQETQASLLIFVIFGLISLGTAGFVISFIDRERYVMDSFITGGILAGFDVIWKIMYDGTINPIFSFSSSFLVFSLTVLLGSFWLFFLNKANE